MKKKIAVLGLIFGAVLVLSGCGKASNGQKGNLETGKGQSRGVQNQNGEKREKQGNPEMFREAKAVCEGRAENDACQFSFKNRAGETQEMTGKCLKNSEDENLFCRPDQKAGPGPKGMFKDEPEEE